MPIYEKGGKPIVEEDTHRVATIWILVTMKAMVAGSAILPLTLYWYSFCINTIGPQDRVAWQSYIALE